MANLWSKKMKEKQLSLLQVSIRGGQESIQEILDDIAMRTTPQEEDIQDVGESSVYEKVISSYLEGFRSASFLASQRELLKAIDGEVKEIDPQLKVELFYEQKKSLQKSVMGRSAYPCISSLKCELGLPKYVVRIRPQKIGSNTGERVKDSFSLKSQRSTGWLVLL